MSRRVKAVCLTLLIFSCLTAIVYNSCETILGNFFSDMEQKEAQESLLRVKDIVQGDLVMMGSLIGDWASWDDAYDFLENGNQLFVNKNISTGSFIELKVNLIMFVHNSGKIVYEGWYDRKTNEISGSKISIRNHLGADSRLLKLTYPTSSSTGLLDLAEGVLMVAARPVVNTKRDALVRGTLIMGRFLDDQEIARLSKESRIPFEVARADDPYLAPEFGKIQTELSQGSVPLIKKSGDNLLVGYGYMNDLYGKPTLILKTSIPRLLIKEGHKITASLQKVILGATAIAGGLLALLLAFFCCSGETSVKLPNAAKKGGMTISTGHADSVAVVSTSDKRNDDATGPGKMEILQRESVVEDHTEQVSEKPEGDISAPVSELSGTVANQSMTDESPEKETGVSPKPDPASKLA